MVRKELDLYLILPKPEFANMISRLLPALHRINNRVSKDARRTNEPGACHPKAERIPLACIGDFSANVQFRRLKSSWRAIAGVTGAGTRAAHRWWFHFFSRTLSKIRPGYQRFRNTFATIRTRLGMSTCMRCARLPLRQRIPT